MLLVVVCKPLKHIKLFVRVGFEQSEDLTCPQAIRPASLLHGWLVVGTRVAISSCAGVESCVSVNRFVELSDSKL